MIIAIFDLQVSPDICLPSFETIDPSIQETKDKIDFLDGRHGGHLGFQIGMISAIFDPQAAPIFPILPSFESVGHSVQETNGKTDFQDGHNGGRLGFPIRTILAI